MIRILFVCLGNICRSPTAEAVFRHRLEASPLAGRIEVDSAGTGDWHIGHPPDRRAQAAGSSRGYDLSGIRARQVGQEDFADFDLVLAMDESNLQDLKALSPPEYHHKLRLFLDYHPEALPTRDVPDPYYGGEQGFDQVLDLVEAAAEGLLETLATSGFQAS